VGEKSHRLQRLLRQEGLGYGRQKPRGAWSPRGWQAKEANRNLIVDGYVP
jgi:hypothetical protein